MFSIIILYDVKCEIIKIEKHHNINLHVLETTATGELQIISIAI